MEKTEYDRRRQTGFVNWLCLTTTWELVRALYELLLLGLLLDLKSARWSTRDARNYRPESSDGAQVAPLSGEPRLMDSAR